MEENNLYQNEFDDLNSMEMEEETLITMTDEEGNEYEFFVYDELNYNGETYLLLLPNDSGAEPELVIVKVDDSDDDSDILVSVDDDEYDEVFEEYQRLLDEEDLSDEEEQYEEDEEEY